MATDSPTNQPSSYNREEYSFITDTSLNDTPLRQFDGSWPALGTAPSNIDGAIHPVDLPSESSRDSDLASNGFNRGLSRRRTVTAIIVGSIGAIFCMIIHHLFLFWLDGRHADMQFWTKNASNAFSQLCVVFIGLVAGSVLSQLVWRTVSRDYTMLSTIDILFSLPSPISILSLSGFAGENRAGWLLLPILMAVFIQALVVISILAPNSLSIQRNGWRIVNTTIPKLDFGSISLYGTPIYNQGPSLGLIIATSGNTWGIWDAPSDCQPECLIIVEYYAPAVQCRDLRAEEITLRPYNYSYSGGWKFYNSHFIPREAENTHSSPEWGQPYLGFWMEYLPSVSQLLDLSHLQVNQTGPPAGIHCDFLDGKFQANFSITSGIKHVKVTPLSYTNGSTDGCIWDSNWNNTKRCADYGGVARRLVPDFANVFRQGVGWERDRNGELYDESEFGDQKLHLALMQLGVNLISIDIPSPVNRTVNNYPSSLVTVAAGSANVSDMFEELFNTIMLAAMVRENRVEFGRAQTSDGANVWIYSRSTLWITYGPATAILLVLTIYGLWHANINKRPLSAEFSTIFITSRNRALDNLFLQDQGSPEEKKMKLDNGLRRFVMQETSEKLGDKESTPLHDQGSHPSSSLPPSVTAPKVMVGAFMMAIALTVVHHVFLTMLREKEVSRFSQFWMRNISNGLSQGVAFCLGVVLTHALTQAVWRAVRLESISIAGIDYLFSLPSPGAMLRRFLGRWNFAFYLAIFITWTTYGLFFISVLAPNVLAINQSDRVPAEFVLPYLNYSFSFVRDVINLEAIASYTPPEDMWITPSICTINCAFEFDYEAPALLCYDVYSDEAIFNGPFSMIGENFPPPGQPLLRVNMTHNNSLLTGWGPVFHRQLEIAYTPLDANISGTSRPNIQHNGDPEAIVCNYTDGTYHAKFQIDKGVKMVTTTLVHYNNSFTPPLFDTYDSYHTWWLQGHYPSNSNRLADVFGRMMECVVGFWQSGTRWSFRELGFDNSYFSTTSPIHPGLLRLFDYHSNVTTDGGEVSLDLKVPSLSQGFVDLFSNFTLNIMREGPNTLTVNGTVWGETVWKVDLFTLWCIYGTALGWSLILGTYGLWAMYDNGAPLDNSVSTIILATRTEELDAAYESMPNRAALSRLRLRHEKKSCFVVDGMQPKVEERGEESSGLLMRAQ